MSNKTADTEKEKEKDGKNLKVHWSQPVDAPTAQTLETAMQTKKTLLPESWAKTVTSASTAVQGGLGSAAALSETLLAALQTGTESALGTVRSSLVGAISVVKPAKKSPADPHKEQSTTAAIVGSLSNAVDRVSDVGIGTVNTVFSFAELLTFGTYHIASSSMKFSFKAASETVNIFNTIFGSTESSRALTHLVSLVQQEILLHDPAFSSRSIFGNTIGAMTLTGGITKAIAAYACLQVMTADRTLEARKIARLIEENVIEESAKKTTAAGLATGAVSWIVGGLAAGAGIRADPSVAPPSENKDWSIDFEARRKKFNWRRGFKTEQEFSRAMEKVQVWNDGLSSSTSSAASFYSDIPPNSPNSPTEYQQPVVQTNSRNTLRSFSNLVGSGGPFTIGVAEQELIAEQEASRRTSTSSNISTAQSILFDASATESDIFEDARSFLGSINEPNKASESLENSRPLGSGRYMNRLSRESLADFLPGEGEASVSSSSKAVSFPTDDQIAKAIEGPPQVDEYDTEPQSTMEKFFDYVKSWIPQSQRQELYNNTEMPGGFYVTPEPKVIENFEYGYDTDVNDSIMEFTLGVSTVFDKVTTSKIEKDGTVRRTHRININILDGLDDSSTSSSEKHMQLDSASVVSNTSSSKQTMGMGRHFPMLNLIDNLVRYSKYATAAYGSEFMTVFDVGNIRKLKSVNDASVPMNHVAFATHVNVPVRDILFSSYTEDNSLFPQIENSFEGEDQDVSVEKMKPITHYISIDREAGVVVVSLRGTLSLSDLIMDLKFDYAEHNGHKMHAGMLHCAQILCSKQSLFIKSIKRALIENPTFGLVLVGHSLGGAVATLLASEWSVQNFKTGAPTPWCTNNSSGLPPNRPIHCFVYGGPCVIDYTLSVQLKGLVTTVIHNTDMIPTMSVGLVRDLKTVTFHLLDPVNKGLSERIIARTLGLQAAGRKPSPEEEDFFFGIISELRMSMGNERLYPGGTVYWVSNTKVSEKKVATEGGAAEVTKSHVVLRRCDDVKEICHEPVFSPFMMSDHIPKNYEACLDALASAVAMKRGE
ncbi:hypothetical protein HK100_000148 [Physocladia obscura]|uniref:sn-1-specific diacylglycerol lipase n=1 Tax=Physocladia obscura TaxID=109957 RepID=A0AAD5XFT4_9FUNG|nr:hypothetical protein HK100_000148 [Physocladia obscura]